MKQVKKVLCIMLAVVMTLSLMSVGVFAANDTTITQTGLISSLIDKLFSGSSGADTGSGLVDAGNGNENIHGIVEVVLDNILNGIASGTFTHGIVTVNTGDLFKDIASHSNYTHGIVTVTGNTTTINFGKLLTDVNSSDTGTSTAARSTLFSVLEALGASAAQSQSALAELLSGKLSAEGLAALVNALSAGKVADAAAIAQILASLNNGGFITVSALTTQLGALLKASTDKAGYLTDVLRALIEASTAGKVTLAGVIESLFSNSVVSQGILASVLNNLNDNLTTQLENGITGNNIADVLKALISGGTYTNGDIIAKLGDIIANGTMSQKTIQAIIEGLFDNGFSGDDIASMVNALLQKGTITNASLAAILNSLVTNGLIDKGKVIDLIRKLLPSGSVNTNPLLKLMLTLTGTTAADIQAKLLKLISDGNSSSILSYLQNLFGSGTSTTLLARLKSLLSGAGLPTLSISTLLTNLNSLLGLGDTDISDEKTALAGNLVLDNVNHNTYVSGFPDGGFHPENYITRADVAVMLYALLTDDSRAMYTSTSNHFSDVSVSAYYYTAVCTMADGGVVSGYPNGTFKPASYISRAEFATVMTAFYGLVTGASSSFYDVSPNAWYYHYVATTSAKGWVTGYPDGTFRPQNSITRAEAVTILNSALNRSCDLSYISSHAGWVRSFSDVWTNSWYYENVMEAANGHTYTRPTASTETWTGLK